MESDAPTTFLEAAVESYTLAGFLGMAFGIALTAVYAASQFNVHNPTEPAAERYARFLPAEMVEKKRYNIFFTVYLFGLIFIYLSVCVAGPSLVTQMSGGGASGSAIIIPDGNAFPFWVALAMNGVIPLIPGLKEVELRWRRFMHDRAAIPKTLRRQKFRFAASHYNFSSVPNNIPDVNSSDIASPPEAGTHQWARLNVIIYRLNRAKLCPGIERILNLAPLEAHLGAIQAAATVQAEISDELHATPGAAQGHARENFLSAKHRKIEQGLDELYSLMASMVVTRPAGVPLADAMRALHFEPAEEDNSVVVDEPEPAGAVLLAAGVSTFLIVFTAHHIPGVFPEPMKAGIPQKPWHPFEWAITAAFMHGAATFATSRLREWRLRKASWFRLVGGSRHMPAPRQYGFAFAVGSVAGALALYFIDGLLQGYLQLDQAFRALFPIGAIAGLNATFVCLLLDLVARGRKLQRCWPIVAVQALALGVMTWAATANFTAVVDWASSAEQVPDAIAKQQFSALVAVFIGLCAGSAILILYPRQKPVGQRTG